MKLWIDDERPAPSDDFVVCRDIFELIDLLHSFEGTETKIDFISFDYYIDPKNNRFTGMDAILEIINFERLIQPILSDTFTFSTHSSEKSRNEKMENVMRAYLSNKII